MPCAVCAIQNEEETLHGARPLEARGRPRVVLLKEGDIQDYAQVLSSPRSKSLASVLPILQLRRESGEEVLGKSIFVGLGLPKDRVPSTGWTAVIAAIHLCQEVALYGFSTPPEAGGVIAWGGHNIAEEHRVWELLDGQEVEGVAPR